MTLAHTGAAGYPLRGDAACDRIAPANSTPGPSSRMTAMPHDVFISYAHADKATADAACATLEQAGIRCWIAPRDITPGEEYGAAIVKAIENCRVMVLIFSASANTSRQTRREVERAINAGVTLVPVRIEDVPPTESFAYFMSSVHWLDALTPPLEEHLQKLAASIKALLQAGVSPPPRAAGPMPAAGLVGEQRDPAMSGAAMGATAEPAPAKPATSRGRLPNNMKNGPILFGAG